MDQFKRLRGLEISFRIQSSESDCFRGLFLVVLALEGFQISSCIPGNEFFSSHAVEGLLARF